MRIKENPKFDECVSLAKEAKSIRNCIQEHKMIEMAVTEAEEKQAAEVEEKAVCEFRKLISETLKLLREQQVELKDELSDLEGKSIWLGTCFCTMIGHEFVEQRIGSQSSKYHTFVGSVHSVYLLTCKLCGKTLISEPFYNNSFAYYRRNIKCKGEYNGEAIKKKVIESLENLNEIDNIPVWKETAEAFLDINQKIEEIKNQLSEIVQALEEICMLFGHDAECVDWENETFKCKCCGKKMGYKEYIDAHFDAKYKGGIIPYYYHDPKPIF